MDRSKWAHLTEKIRVEMSDGYFTVFMLINKDLEVCQDPVNYSVSIVTPDMPLYHAILEVVGPMIPGNYLSPEGEMQNPKREVDGAIVGMTLTNKLFSRQENRPYIEVTPSEFELCMSTGYYEKIEVCQDGSILVWDELNEGKESERRAYSAQSPHKAILENHVGPLKPGDIVVFEEIGEFKFQAKRSNH